MSCNWVGEFVGRSVVGRNANGEHESDVIRSYVDNSISPNSDWHLTDARAISVRVSHQAFRMILQISRFGRAAPTSAGVFAPRCSGRDATHIPSCQGPSEQCLDIHIEIQGFEIPLWAMWSSNRKLMGSHRHFHIKHIHEYSLIGTRF